MKQSLEWFTSRIGEDIIRVYQEHETRVEVIDKETAKIMHTRMRGDGFTFKDTHEHEFSFDLPTVEAKTTTKPRIHISDNNCISCEG